jgi:NAD(P)-dependent dehydrogenase (short-subunit alcohol dehydrogenase family)
MQFEGKTAIVTGAAQGIGEAYAHALAARGAAVVVADLNDGLAGAVAEKITADGGTAAAVRVDVSDPASTDAMAAFAAERFGGVDLLVNNAAIYGDMKFDVLIGVDLDYYKKFMSVNMDGVLHCTRSVYRSMRKRGGGAIVNQSSTAAWTYSGFYGLAKVGVNGLTQQLAHELGSMGTRADRHGRDPQRRR